VDLSVGERESMEKKICIFMGKAQVRTFLNNLFGRAFLLRKLGTSLRLFVFVSRNRRQNKMYQHS